jgi:8-oxo-dGTP diphosphatase
LKTHRVAYAVIMYNNTILVVQTSELMSLPLKWEFPGGKIEPNETAEECIVREIYEELNITVTLQKALSPSYFEYNDFAVQLFPFLANYADGDIILTQHKQYELATKEALILSDFAQADLPIIKEILSL